MIALSDVPPAVWGKILRFAVPILIGLFFIGRHLFEKLGERAAARERRERHGPDAD